jgi:multidrug efflux system membrane fusion protein
MIARFALTGVILATATASHLPSEPDGFPGFSRPAEVRELAFGVRGMVAEVLVEPGDRVEGGQTLIRLDDAVQSATLALARNQADDQSTLELARAAVKFRADELALVLDSSESGGANQQEVRAAQFAHDRARLELAGAEAQARERALTVDREAARLGDMSVTAPIAGDIVDIHKREGETVDELTTVVTLVNIDRLRIDVSVPPSLSRRLRAGDPADILWKDIDAAGPVRGKVILVSATGDPSVREVGIRVEVENPDRLPSGLHAEVSFPEPVQNRVP